MSRTSLYLFMLLLVVWVLLSTKDDVSHGNEEERRRFERAWWKAYDGLSYSDNSTYTLMPSSMRHRVDSLLNMNASRSAASPESLTADTYFPSVSGIYTGSWLAEDVNQKEHVAQNGFVLTSHEHPADKSHGRLTMTLGSEELEDKTLKLLHGSITLHSDDYSAVLSLQGLYWSSHGAAVLYAVREPNARAAADLLRAVPGETSFAQAKAFLGEAMKERLSLLERYEYVEHGCEYQFYMQFNPIRGSGSFSDSDHSTGSVGGLLEASRIFKTDLYSSELQAQLIMYSPDCGVTISTPRGQHASGISSEHYRRKTIHYALAALVVLLAQIVLLVFQAIYTSTPAIMAKLSYQMLSMQVIIDSLTFVLHMVGSLSFGNIYIVFSVVAFLTYMVLMAFGSRYLTVVWRLQRPEMADPTTDESRRELWRIYICYYIILIPGAYIFCTYLEGGGLFVKWMTCTMLFATYSYWIPQIWRNARRGTSGGLRKEYIVGVTFLRLFFPIYLFGYSGNIALNPPTFFIWVLCAYSVAQAGVLLLQDALGPRFFIPAHLRPEGYDYHHPLPLAAADSDESTVIDIDGILPSTEQPESLDQSSDAGATDQDSTEHETAVGDSSTPDCAICMTSVDSAVPSANQQDRATYMVTPCRHVYHTECLSRWMDIKLECPICRASLPPV
ncbi:hypothetical protein H4S06_002150 [Coemansia sp. BCRC 34490]|nr:hypothetical protein H4S06_002150 [Coemansia sp. BCRC 34490]